jgi:hypothetical protein
MYSLSDRIEKHPLLYCVADASDVEPSPAFRSRQGKTSCSRQAGSLHRSVNGSSVYGRCTVHSINVGLGNRDTPDSLVPTPHQQTPVMKVTDKGSAESLHPSVPRYTLRPYAQILERHDSLLNFRPRRDAEYLIRLHRGTELPMAFWPALKPERWQAVAPGNEPPPDARREPRENEPRDPKRPAEYPKPLPDTSDNPLPVQPHPAPDQPQRKSTRTPDPPPNFIPARDPPDPALRLGPPLQRQLPQALPEPIFGAGGAEPPALPPSSMPGPDAMRFYWSWRDDADNTLLMQACRYGDTALASLLLAGCPPGYTQALNMFGRNAAMIASDRGHAVLLALLQQAGVELQPENPALQWYLMNCADLAIRRQDWSPLAALLAQDHYMNLRDADGRTLLFHAVMHADLDAVRFLCGCHDAPFLGWKDLYGHSVFRYTTRIAHVQTGTAICEELRTHRRRMRWQRKRERRASDERGRELAASEPVWRSGGEVQS